MFKRLALLCLYIVMSTSAQTTGNNDIRNLLASPPYNDTEMGRKMLVDQPYLFMMQVALKPGQMVPEHLANSNVNIIVLDGDVVIILAGKGYPAKKGDLVPIAFKTPMSIKNGSKANATFVIIKAPNPSEMEQ